VWNANRSESMIPSPGELARHYSEFRVGERILLTGHSHQAWPDLALEAQIQAWRDAADRVDEKWEAAYAVADRVREAWRRLLGDEGSGEIALGPNTHELVARFLSALPLERRPGIVTTDAEFHTIRRQLDRLAETGWVRVKKVAGRPVEGVAERLAAAVDDGTSAVLVSSVYFATAEVVPGLAAVAEACHRHGAELLVDSYHHLNALPFSLSDLGLEGAWVVGGGYKYCQFGEGNCFLRFPAETQARPVFTGWFSEFAELAATRDPDEVRYGKGPARFMGATYDPVSHYRAAAVADFFLDQGLTPEALRSISQRQVARLARGVSRLVGEAALPGLRRGLENVGGFLAVELPGGRTPGGVPRPDAETVRVRLRQRGVLTDHRGDLLRLGPAPYVTDRQLDDALGAMEEALRR
jgi:kynureninase